MTAPPNSSSPVFAAGHSWPTSREDRQQSVVRIGRQKLTSFIDGLILCKLINDSVPDTIDERVLNKGSSSKTKPKPLNAFQITENNNIVITSAKGIGCSVVNIGPSDIAEGREHLILGLIWQIIRRGLLSKIDIKIHPELYRLLDDGETLEEFLRLPPDQILLRWFNYHLKAAGWKRRSVSVFFIPLHRALTDILPGSRTSQKTFQMEKITPSSSTNSSPLNALDLHSKRLTSTKGPSKSSKTPIG